MSDGRTKQEIMAIFNKAGACIAIAAAGFFTVVLFTNPAAFTALPDGGIECVHTIMLIIIFGFLLNWHIEWKKEKGGGD